MIDWYDACALVIVIIIHYYLGLICQYHISFHVSKNQTLCWFLIYWRRNIILITYLALVSKCGIIRYLWFVYGELPRILYEARRTPHRLSLYRLVDNCYTSLVTWDWLCNVIIMELIVAYLGLGLNCNNSIMIHETLPWLEGPKQHFALVL